MSTAAAAIDGEFRRVALLGNPNCGKTALFNLLTGSRQKVANYAGVTVERKEGIARSADDVDVVKLHGYGFPRWRGGPMHYAESRDGGEMAALMRSVAGQSPHSWKVSKRFS